MNDEKKTSKRKILARYVALAACILLIAAVTVTAIAAANNWFRPDVFIDSGNDGEAGKKPEDKPEDKPDDKPEDKPNGGDENQEGGDKDTSGGDKNDNPASAQVTFALPVEGADVTCEYDFIQNASMCGIWYFHEAIDMAAAAGTDVVCCLDGTVEKVTVDDQLDGTSVTVAHANGVKTVYSFIDAKEGLKEGDKLKRGEVIGTIAQPTGNEYLQGAHLHFAVYENGKSADPASYLDISIK